MTPASAERPIPSSRGPRALRPDQLRNTFPRSVSSPEPEALAVAPAAAAVPTLLADEGPPASNGPVGLRSTDLAAALAELAKAR